MLTQKAVDEDEEQLRGLARELTEDQRKVFYQDLKDQLRDPDTYAALNWFFIAGLHHFYLGRWLMGLFDLAIFTLGFLLILGGQTWLGLVLIFLVSCWELWALFRAQIIVQDWNNRIFRKLLIRRGISGR